MAKIKINGDSSGYVEIVAPNAAHNNTLELGPGTKILTDKNTHTSSIGIGTDNPTETLTLNHANGASIGLEYSGTENGTINVNSAAMYVRAGTGKHLILGSNGTEKLRIDSNGNIGIGVNNPSSFNSDGRNLVVGTGSGGQGISIYSANNSYGTIYFADGTSGSELYRGGLLYNHASDFLRFDTAGAEKVRITSGGDVGIGDNSPNSNYGTNLSVHSTATDGARLKLSDGTTGKGNTDGFDIISTGGVAYILNRENADMSFSTNNTERLRIGSGGGHKITCAEGYYAANLTECNDGRIALNINQTRQGQTKAIAIGAISDNSATGIQCYDTSNNSANNLILNPFGGNMGLGTNNPTSDGGTTFEIYDDTTPSIRLNDGGAYKSLFQLRGNDLEIRGSNGQLEFYTGNADGASSSLRGAITSAGHKWTHNGSIFHGSNDVTDFTNAARDTYNNVSIRAGQHNAGTTPTNTNSAIKIYPAGVRSTTTGNLTGGITWQHLDPNYGDWGTRFGDGAQIWMGAALHDTPGQERDRFNLWMNDQTSEGTQPNNLAIEAYPNGIVRHPKVPSFLAKGGTALSNSSNIVIVGSGTEFNNGGHYSTSNGRFTAPIAGIYHFSFWGLLYPHSSGVINIFYSRNGTQYGHIVQGGSDSNSHTSRAGSIMMSMSAGDYAELRINRGNNTGVDAYGSQWNMCGFLVG